MIVRNCPGRLKVQLFERLTGGMTRCWPRWTRFSLLHVFDVSDVWQSEVVKSRPLSSQYAAEMLVIPFELKRARRDIVLQDPLATQLGASRRGRLDQGSLHYDTDQSFRDCFRMKA